MSLERVLVVGAGLIGASVGLALGDSGVHVTLTDQDPDRLRLAMDLGAGSAVVDHLDAPGGPTDARRFDLVLLAVPPTAVAGELIRAQRMALAATYSDTASIKTQPQAEAQEASADMASYLGGHPVAGRERAGPGNARADLFLGRPWVLTPTAETSPASLAAVRELAERCGATPSVMTAAGHDQAMALVSHLPQAVASVLAGMLVGAEPAAVGLAGSAFRDLTRIADSDPELWAQIAAGNAEPLAAALRRAGGELTRLAEDLDSARADAGTGFRSVVAAGNAGRQLLPGKHGDRVVPYVPVPVVVVDEPGALARLLADAGAAGVNVEDLTLEHSPGAAVGLCELLVRPDEVDRLAAVLTAKGWAVHQQRHVTPAQ